ncbi:MULTISPECIES: maleylpyruvate isomerase family mycothiol-dependent enzyme [unclassified Streptomyces]|uniref:maleylpyruvate isomerase family mycothiol-dependent enzyme n=1 Tax=unclassified Streptomyces TaxID=2593676 RepID=UPI00037C0DEE|nr:MULTISPECIES: maleylpyruvate isomerase family mycothiol-dependent enzyme [unclassified Streptomyces]MYT30785.1 maleylpyruvate isomerase family mycothiol-dependent enzyme [Streptomyces sp. SID8354]
MTFQGSLAHEEYCAQLLVESEKFREIVRHGDLTAKVPTCPDWTLADLARHVGGAHRWAGELVATRATAMIDPTTVAGAGGPAEATPEAFDAWLAEGAERTVAALREAGPDAPVWSWAGDNRAGFWARRMVHETVIHRADAALTTGAAYEVPPEIAADCLDEWLELCASPAVAERWADRAEDLFGPGRTLHLHATDTPPALHAEWLLDLTGEHFTHRRAHEKAAVALRAPLTDLLLAVYRRRPADDGIEVLGDRSLFDRWLTYASFA